MSSFVEELERNDIYRVNAYVGNVAHPNGRIYGIPYNASRVAEYNPSTNTTRLVGDDLRDVWYDDDGWMNEWKWWGGTVGSDGCVYCCPSSADRILKYDPTTETTTLVGDPVEGYAKYISAVSVPATNSIYFIPFNADRILRYNIIDETTSFVGDTFDYGGKWKSACLSRVDGCIYCTPDGHPQVLKFDPIDGSTALIGEEYDGDHKWGGCSEAPDGCIYCAPCWASSFLKIDVTTGTTSRVGKVPQREWRGGWRCCVPSTINGNMHIFVVAGGGVDRNLMFDTSNESVQEVRSGICGHYFDPAISSFDGNAYAIPHYSSESILKINFSLLQTVHEAIQVKGMPWPMLQSIAESNIHALEEGDSNTGLLPFMMAASLASLTLSYQLLSMKPAVMNHYV